MDEVLTKYFWDIDPETIDLKKHHRYVIERLAELGDEEAAQWMLAQYGAGMVREIVLASRRVSPKSKSYWRTVLPSTSP